MVVELEQYKAEIAAMEQPLAEVRDSLDLAGNYLDSAQHPFYFFLVPEAHDFLYLVSDGNDIYIERYTPDETRSAAEIISEFVSFLTASNLMDEYKTNWQIAP